MVVWWSGAQAARARLWIKAAQADAGDQVPRERAIRGVEIARGWSTKDELRQTRTIRSSRESEQSGGGWRWWPRMNQSMKTSDAARWTGSLLWTSTRIPLTPARSGCFKSKPRQIFSRQQGPVEEQGGVYRERRPVLCGKMCGKVAQQSNVGRRTGAGHNCRGLWSDDGAQGRGRARTSRP